MRLTIIGAMGSMSGPASPASCCLVQCPGLGPLTDEIRTWSIVLEVGSGSLGTLWRHIDPRMTDTLVLSHTHAGHMGDIISLQVFRRWGPGPDLEPLPLAGPVGTLERIRQIDEMRLPGIYEGKFDIRTVRAGQSYHIGPMALTPSPEIHAVESFGTRIVGPLDSPPLKAVSMFFADGMGEAPVILEGARGIDPLLTEVGFTRMDTAYGIHIDGVRVGRLAARAEVACPVMTHIRS